MNIEHRTFNIQHRIAKSSLARHFDVRCSMLNVRCFVLSFLIFLSASLSAEDLSSAFNQANKLFEQQRFPDAAAAYEKIIQSGQISAPLYFNLGNAWFKSGQIGRAIAAYRQAEKLSPRDGDIRGNLGFARDEVHNGNSPRTNVWNRALDLLTLNEWTFLAGGTLSLWFLLMAAGEWKTELKKTMRGYVIALGTLAALMIVVLTFAVQRKLFTPVAVVIAPEAVIRRGPFEESQSAFSVRDGTELSVLESRDKWVQVADSANRIGWLSDQQVIVIR